MNTEQPSRNPKKSTAKNAKFLKSLFFALFASSR